MLFIRNWLVIIVYWWIYGAVDVCCWCCLVLFAVIIDDSKNKPIALFLWVLAILGCNVVYFVIPLLQLAAVAPRYVCCSIKNKSLHAATSSRHATQQQKLLFTLHSIYLLCNKFSFAFATISAVHMRMYIYARMCMCFGIFVIITDLLLTIADRNQIM